MLLLHRCLAAYACALDKGSDGVGFRRTMGPLLGVVVLIGSQFGKHVFLEAANV